MNAFKSKKSASLGLTAASYNSVGSRQIFSLVTTQPWLCTPITVLRIKEISFRLKRVPGPANY